MATINNFEDLEIWQEARRMYQKVLVLLNNTALEKNLKFKNQISEAAGSVMDNIAEGFERDSRLEFINFLSYSKGSAGETRSQLYRGFDYGYWDDKTLNEMNAEYKSLASHIANFIKYLNSSNVKGQKFKDR
ncbi:MAG: four helix bundle protein [Sphingobacteriales bacterium]|nr:four helix bundle protein [Sphingobacteriales bacterium]MBI3719565.1 four helix bundle protein [Sphingobacteriales bacterium]